MQSYEYVMTQTYTVEVQINGFERDEHVDSKNAREAARNVASNRVSESEFSPEELDKMLLRVYVHGKDTEDIFKYRELN
jgi:hypothetical protein